MSASTCSFISILKIQYWSFNKFVRANLHWFFLKKMRFSGTWFRRNRIYFEKIYSLCNVALSWLPSCKILDLYDPWFFQTLRSSDPNSKSLKKKKRKRKRPLMRRLQNEYLSYRLQIFTQHPEPKFIYPKKFLAGNNIRFRNYRRICLTQSAFGETNILERERFARFSDKNQK